MISSFTLIRINKRFLSNLWSSCSFHLKSTNCLNSLFNIMKCIKCNIHTKNCIKVMSRHGLKRNNNEQYIHINMHKTQVPSTKRDHYAYYIKIMKIKWSLDWFIQRQKKREERRSSVAHRKLVFYNWALSILFLKHKIYWFSFKFFHDHFLVLFRFKSVFYWDLSWANFSVKVPLGQIRHHSTSYTKKSSFQCELSLLLQL